MTGGIGLSRRLLGIHEWETKMEIMGFILGAAALVFALSALAKISKLQSQLNAAGVLGNKHEAD